MSNQYINYVEFDSNEQCPIARVGCMVCNQTIAIRERRRKDHRLRIKHFSNIHRQRVYLSDHTYADLLLCSECSITNLKKAEKTMHHGWMVEEKWKYITSKNPIHVAKKKARFNLGPTDPLPLSYFKQLFKYKKILRKGDK